MEALYHYLWKFKMMGRKLAALNNGQTLEIISPGVFNSDSGPDFFNAKIKLGGAEWVGNVEIHVKASDWFRHHHDQDPAYDNIILHVVGISDTLIHRADGSVIPQVEVTLPEGFFLTYGALMSGLKGVRCSGRIAMLSRLQIIDWIETLAVERLQVKSSRLLSLLSTLAGDWEQVCFVALARALGFGLNGEPFEMLAKSLTLNTLARHSDNLLQIEALLFGQAGMLDASAHIFDEYYQTLCREYYFLARKYGLRPMRRDLWKYARTRPGNFPHRRVALLARYLEGGFSMFARIIDANGDEEKLRAIFSKSLDGYWGSHSSFDTEAASTPDVLSRGSIDSLLINVASPIYYAYGATIGNPDLAEKAPDLLSALPPERNSLVRMLVEMGLPAANAMQSQALIHLRKEYCDCNKCLFCRFGHLMLRREAVSL